MTGVVLVEGRSDAAALEAAAGRLGLDLTGTRVVPLGGVTNLRAALRGLPPGTAVRGLCDAAEAPYVARVLALDDLAAAGFGVCVADLEDELVRALGADAVVGLIEAQGQLASFRSLQQQPAQRDRAPEAQLRRFFGSGSGRKLRYARVLAEALPPEALPAPLRVALGVPAAG